MKTALVLVGLLIALSTRAAPALAAADDEIPGAPLGSTAVSERVDAQSDPSDVYSLDLSAGQEVRVVCTTKAGSAATGRFRMLAPSTSSLSRAAAEPEAHVQSSWLMTSGTLLFSKADFAYVAARPGTYFLWMLGTEGALSYDLQATHTGRPPLSGPDTDDIPGLPLATGSTVGVVDTLTDRSDLFKVKLFAGQPVTLRLVPTASDDSFGGASLSLLAPESTSIGTGFAFHRAVPYDPSHSAYNRTPDDVGILAFTPAETGIYHVWVQASMIVCNFPYRLEVSGAAAPPDDEEPPDTPVFPDVGTAHPYRTAIEGMYLQGIVSGYANGLFGPADPVKRAQFAKMIAGVMDLDTIEGMYHPFTDLEAENPAGDPYPHEYVAAAFANGITQGLTPTTFGPYVPVSRAQVVTMIVRAIQSLHPGTLATPPSGYGTLGMFDTTHSPNLAIAEYNGLLDGLQAFDPEWDPWATATRGECAHMLWNVLQR